MTNDNNDFEQYKNDKHTFKRTCDLTKSELHRSKREQLLNNRNNPKKIWDQIKKSKANKRDSNDSISGEDWYNYLIIMSKPMILIEMIHCRI